MNRIRLDLLINIVICLAILSLIASVLILFDPWSIADSMSTRANLSQSMSTALALVLGTIAIVVAAGVERTEYRAQESVRRDIAVLAATLHSALLKSALLAVSGDQQVSFDVEKRVFGDFMCSTTCFAFICWTGVKSKETVAGSGDEKWRTFLFHLAELQAGTDRNTAAHLRQYADDLLDCIEGLSDDEIRRISRYVKNVGKAFKHYKAAHEELAIIKALRQQAKAGPPKQSLPPEDVIERVLAAAEREGPGLASELRTTLKEARDGHQESIILFLGVAEVLMRDEDVAPDDTP